ncbi:ATP/GTP-binding protein [Streptomyces sp. NBC_01462]|uniref:ATP/GTP-binding protein n=1 Tax=Streptomyces sp. NBC_01462 TaxID=2903876 RepID=UPI002E31CFD8|nr:ATP/GTP-binding protein [Streptomyces sp. NBC_01462]
MKRLVPLAAFTVLAGSGLTGQAVAQPPAGGGMCTTQPGSWVSVCADDHTARGGTPGRTGKAAKPGGKGAAAGPPPCEVQKMSPQPAAGSALWDGHRPGDGAVYTRVCPAGIAGAQAAGSLILPIDTFWSATAPAPAVDPRLLAQQAVDKMLLQGPDIKISPHPGSTGLIGMPVWMAAGQSATTWGPNTANASAGAVTVTATAKVSQVVWSMGDGTSVTCHGPGSVYKTSFGLRKSPTCGHVYTEPSSTAPSGRYRVTATATWDIDWQVDGGGETGQLTEVRTSAVALTITQSQALNS